MRLLDFISKEAVKSVGISAESIVVSCLLVVGSGECGFGRESGSSLAPYHSSLVTNHAL